MKTEQYVRLENLGKGAVEEMFQAELDRAVANISDPNTKAETARTITIKMKIKPNKDRSLCAVEVGCNTALAPVRPFETSIMVGMDRGKGVASEYSPGNQLGLTVENQDGEVVDVKTGVVLKMARK